MLLNYNAKTASESEKETIKYLYEELQKLRPNLINLATETDDNDDGIGEILKTNDQCEKIINQYKLMFLNEITNGNHNNHVDDVKLVNLGSSVASFDEVNKSSKTEQQTSNYDPLKELQDLFSTPSSSSIASRELINNNNQKSNNFDDFLSINDPVSVTNNIESLLSSINIQSNHQISLNNQAPLMQPLIPPLNMNANNANNSSLNFPMPKTQTQQNNAPKTPQLKALDDLNQLGKI